MNVLALFAGVGGLELGIKLAVPSARVVCYVEREAFAASILVAQIEAGNLDSAPIWSDAATFDGAPWRGVVDLVVGGFPCQPYSVAGAKRGSDDERDGWPHVVRILRDVRPRYAFLENVPGLLAGFGRILGDLAAIGFDAEWCVLSAADVGAPHLRRRLFILAADTSGRRFSSADAERHELWHEPERATGGRVDVQRGRQTIARDDGKERSFADTAGARLQGAKSARNAAPRRVPSWRPWSIDTMPQPAICRMDDGLADRVDRLRATGNGVVPQQAAAAFRELWGRMHGLTREQHPLRFDENG